MRILITGGAGFIGSHLSDRLLAEGHHVVCLDNFFTGRRDNVEHLLDHPGFELLRHDVCEPLFLEVDQIYNLACPASPVHYQYNPVKTVKSNVMGTLNMLVLAKRVGARILQASTSEVYGDPTVHPQTESYWGNVNPIGPRACYDEGKRVAETLMSDYHREDAVDIRIARIFNTYGPRMAENDGRVVSNFIVQALRGQELTLYGTGEQTRSFCYVDDLVDGLVRLMNIEGEGRHVPVNLGNPVEFTIRELAEEVVKVVGGETRVVFKPLPQDDPTQRQPDITRAREWLGWEPRLQLAEGLALTVEYFRHGLRVTRGEDQGDSRGRNATGITARRRPAGYIFPATQLTCVPAGRPRKRGSLMTRRLPLVPLSTLLALGLAAGISCARNPVTGKSELSLVSESQEIAMGKESAAQVQQSIGFYDDPAVQAYVSELGMRMAKASERPNLPWEFHVVNDASVNAFALPGGFIFVTRGLMTSINDEAELATVVGHEIGHVTNRHSVQQISKAQVAQLGLGVGSILSSDVARMARLASQGLGVLFLKYSRDAENQADEAGFRYALNQNYDVREMANVFQTLERVSAAGGGGRLPEWLATHPNPGTRIQNIEKRLDTLHKDLTKSVINRDQYLAHVRNMTYGEDPRQGFFENGMFYHPDLRFQVAFPSDWKTQNTAEAVMAGSPQQDAIIQLTLAGKTPPREAAQQFLSQQGIKAGSTSTASVNGLPAASGYFQAETEQGAIQGLVTFISYSGNTYSLLGYTPAGKLSTYDNIFRQTINSFSQLRNQAALSVQPARVELVKLTKEMTLEQFNSQYPSSIPIAELAIINELESPATAIPAGRTVKRVVGGRTARSSSP